MITLEPENGDFIFYKGIQNALNHVDFDGNKKAKLFVYFAIKMHAWL